MLLCITACSTVLETQMLRVVESLPLTSDDMHHTRSAHGSFADLLRDLAQSTDFEVRQRSRLSALLAFAAWRGCKVATARPAAHRTACYATLWLAAGVSPSSLCCSCLPSRYRSAPRRMGC